MAQKKFIRRILREKVMQILYAYELNNENLETTKNGILSDISQPEDREFAEKLLHCVVLHQGELDDEIKKRVSNWEIERIAMIDRILMRIGMCELAYLPDIPPKVSINEAIEIAKNFSTASSGKFINGILDGFLNDLKKDGKLNKSGRGLINETPSKPL
ncbi:MAG: transcription antitermination factor NusB [Ignavibacteria bacterium CG22_combo_CG10-13_8_21_14_all_37_15]|nr:MAG: transcription antitermination factor NusB [Ignavibacteria bacterium CG22_combo_CG10-13_8_21_14_all_37_15]